MSQFIAESLDQGLQTDVIYTDFSKAFDKMDQAILLHKLSQFGLSGKLCKFLGSYLYNRISYVECCGHKSSIIHPTSGVPQGSVLGPLLFNFFINDITVGLSSYVLLYADDLKLFRQIFGYSDCIKLQTDIDKINRWCEINQLPLNTSKCSAMTYTRKLTSVNFQYEINNCYLCRPSLVKDLGILFDKDLSFKDQIIAVTSTASKSLGFVIRNCRDISNLDVCKLLYFSFVRSKLEYAANIWGPLYATHIAAVEKVQRRFLKYLSFRTNGVYPPQGVPQVELCRNFSMKMLTDRAKYSHIIFFHKIVTSKLDCSEILKMIKFYCSRLNSRLKKTVFLSKARTNMLQHSPLFKMCNLVNSLPIEVDVVCTSISHIKAIESSTLKYK